MVEYKPWNESVADVRGKMSRGELIPDPEWQRGYIWKSKDEILLIDSILRGVPIPKFYLTIKYDEKKKADMLYAVDGQQRLQAINRFLNNKYAITYNEKESKFKDLDSETQKRITTYELTGHSLLDYEQQDINFLFQRLNRTGIKLTNMEEWNNEFFGTKILKMIKEIESEFKKYYEQIIYTEDDIKRLLPFDDIIDLCNCIVQNDVVSGGKRKMAGFLNNHRNISSGDSSNIKKSFRCAIKNMKSIISEKDLKESLFGVRTHFVSLFLAVFLLCQDNFLLADIENLRRDLLDFIENQPPKYKESSMGGIRHKERRRVRIKLLIKILKKHAKKLDSKRLFDEKAKKRLWSAKKYKCKLCKKRIHDYSHCCVDHILPWAKGGKTNIKNAQLAHRYCNLEKN